MLTLEGGLYSARVGLNHGQFTLLDDEAKPMRPHTQRNLSVCQQCSCAVSAKPGRQYFFENARVSWEVPPLIEQNMAPARRVAACSAGDLYPTVPSPRVDTLFDNQSLRKTQQGYLLQL